MAWYEKVKGRDLELQDYLSLIEFEKYPSRRAFTKTQLNTIWQGITMII